MAFPKTLHTSSRQVFRQRRDVIESGTNPGRCRPGPASQGRVKSGYERLPKAGRELIVEALVRVSGRSPHNDADDGVLRRWRRHTGV